MLFSKKIKSGCFLKPIMTWLVGLTLDSDYCFRMDVHDLIWSCCIADRKLLLVAVTPCSNVLF